jgi:hypothetical protein
VLLLRARIAQIEMQEMPLEEYENYLATVNQFESKGKVLNSSQTEVAAEVELALGDLLNRNTKHEAASAHWQAVIERLRPFLENGNYPALTTFALAKLRLGEIIEARALAVRLKASQYRHPAYAVLISELTHVTGHAQLTSGSL